jgi:hypothetical protein
MDVLETVLVIAIVAAAACYATWSLLPGAVRVRGLSAFVRLLDSDVPLPAILRERLRNVALSRASRGSGCGHCSGHPRAPLKSRHHARLRRTRD